MGVSWYENTEQLTLFAEDSLANHSQLQESEERKQMTVISGLRCLELYKSASPLGSLVRMLLASSNWHSKIVSLTWKPKGTKSNRLLFRLVPSMPHTEGTGSGFWRTPAASDGEGGVMKMHKDKTGHYKLRDHVQEINREFWPTPQSSDQYYPNLPHDIGRNYLRTEILPNQNIASPEARQTGTLNPMWVETMMGYPLNWTEVD